MHTHLDTISDPAASARPVSMLSITLQVGSDGLTVLAVEITGDDMMTRCSFRRNRRPDAVLAPALAAVVEEMVAEAGTEVGIISKPDFSLPLPGILLTKARIMVSRARGLARYVSVRFGQCFGNVVGAFAPGMQPWQMGHDQSAAVAAETLERVFVPLRNFAAYLDLDPVTAAGGPEGPLGEGLKATRRRIEELEVYYNMLADFIAAQSEHPARHSEQAVARLAQTT
jgi:hypothetical protein